MNAPKGRKLQKISRQAEEQNLAKTLQVIHRNVETYGRDVDKMRDEIDDMLEHFHDDNPELINTLENTLTMHDHMKRALERTRKGIRIHPLDLSVTLGGLKDPAETAKLYAYLHAGMWTAMPLLEKVIDIPDPHLHVGMDFSEAETVLEGEAALKAHVGTLLLAALTVGIPALKWFLRWKKQAKLAANQPKVSERTESNGP